MHEMAALSPSLSLLNRIERIGVLPVPPKGIYSTKLEKFMKFLRSGPDLSEIMNHTYMYPYYYRVGLELAR